MTDISFTITLSITVHDLAAFVDAARRAAMEDKDRCLSWKDAVELIADENLPAAAVQLFRPGTQPAGCRIDGSEVAPSRHASGPGERGGGGRTWWGWAGTS